MNTDSTSPPTEADQRERLADMMCDEAFRLSDIGEHRLAFLRADEAREQRERAWMCRHVQ